MVTATLTKLRILKPEPTKKAVLSEELERIRLTNGGILLAEQVVEAAAPIKSPLHKYFQWDDNEAARQYRIYQARQLINVAVVMLPFTRRAITAYVSLRADRQLPQGGYRALVDVLSNAVQREMLLREALDDLNTWERKYNHLVELAPVFEAIKKVRKVKKN